MKTVGWSVRHPFLVGFLIAPCLVVIAFTQMKKIPDNSPEAQDLQDLTIQYEFSENYHYAKIERDFVLPVEKYLLANKDKLKIKDVSTWYNNNNARTEVSFDKERVTLEQLKDIRKEMAKGLPVIAGADIKLGRQEGAENQNWVGVNIYGDDPSKLQDIAREARTRLRARPGFSEIHTDSDKGREEVQIRLNRELAKKYNISSQSLASLLGIVVRGRRFAATGHRRGRSISGCVSQASDRSEFQDLRSIVVGAGPDGREVTLDQVAKLDIVKTPGNIRREDRRTFTMMFVVYGGEKKEEGKKLISEVMDSMNLPAGLRVELWVLDKARRKGGQRVPVQYPVCACHGLLPDGIAV